MTLDPEQLLDTLRTERLAEVDEECAQYLLEAVAMPTREAKAKYITERNVVVYDREVVNMRQLGHIMKLVIQTDFMADVRSKVAMQVMRLVQLNHTRALIMVTIAQEIMTEGVTLEGANALLKNGAQQFGYSRSILNDKNDA